MDLKLPLRCLVVVAALSCGCGPHSEGKAPSRSEAEAFMASYMSALRSGDAAAIKEHWSAMSLARPGFEVMHLWVRGLIHIREWKAFLDSTRYDYRIERLKGREGYCLVEGEWRSPGRETHPMPFYMVRENGRWLLANPIDVLTRGWRRHETASMVFLFPSEIRLEDHLEEMDRLDEECRTMCRIMGFTPDRKIEYYKASSPDECGRLLTQGAFNGLAAASYQDSIPWFRVAVSTAFYNPHEVMHVVSLAAGVPYSNSFFCEGLAVAFGGTTFQTPGFAHVYSRIMADRPGFLPVKRLLAMSGPDFLQSSPLSHQESGSFIRWLVDSRGWDGVKAFISGFDPGGDADALAVRVFGATPEGLEGQWREFLAKIDLPNLGFTVPKDAVLVFAMEDPENDDRGDGDYRYPRKPEYANGSFDLTRFEVFKTGDSVCFRIGLKKVIGPVVNWPGGAEFLPAVVIAINTGEGRQGSLFRSTNEVELPDGYDLKINVGFGVNVSNRFGKIFTATGDRYRDMVDFQSNTLTFALPLELVGEPGPDWSYCVGIGLSDARTFDFCGLVPVSKDVPLLIGGGNFEDSNPAFIDVLLPEGTDQAAILSDYDPENRKLASLRMVRGQRDAGAAVSQ